MESAKAPSPKRELKRQGATISVESNSSDTSEGSTHDGYFPLKVRGGLVRRLAGYQVGIYSRYKFFQKLYL